MKPKLRLIASLLVIIIFAAALLAGCSKPATTVTPAPTGQGDATKPAATPTATPVDPTTVKYDPEITVTMVRYIITSSTIKFDDVNKSYDDNVWISMIKEKLGINVKYLWYVDRSQYDQKFSLMTASGAYPDVFQVFKANELRQLVDNGLLADITDAYAACGADTPVKKCATGIQDIYFTLASKDGRLYGVPEGPGGPTTAQSITLRQDWLKNLKLADPASMADLIKVAKAFTTQDPDGNQKNDTLGLYVTADPLFDARMAGFYNSYHAYPGIYVPGSDGSLIAGVTTDGMKNALAALQDLYKAGAISPEYATMDDNKIKEIVANGKLGIWYGYFYEPILYQQANLTNDPTTEYKVYQLLSSDSTPASPQGTAGVEGWFVASKKSEHPEALLNLMNICLWAPDVSSPDYKEWNLKYGTTADGSQVQWFHPLSISTYYDDPNSGLTKQMTDYQGYFSKKLTKDQVMGSNVTTIENGEKYKAGDPSTWCWDFIFREGGTVQSLMKYVTDDNVQYDQFTGYLTDATAQKLAVANNILVQAVTDIIKGADVNSYDQAVEQWKAAGGADALKEVNAWYAQFK